MKPCNRRNFLKAAIVSPVAATLITTTKATETDQNSESEVRRPSLSGTDLSLLLHCIAQVESGNDDTKVGPNGERSRYQISHDVWQDRMCRDETDFGTITYHRPFIINCHGTLAAECAMRHLRWLDRHLPRITIIEVHFRHFALAWAWHGGLSSWLNQDKPYHVPTEKLTRCNNYATRVTNLYAALSPKQIS